MIGGMKILNLIGVVALGKIMILRIVKLNLEGGVL